MSGIKRFDVDGVLEYSQRTGDVIGAEVRPYEMEKGSYVLFTDHEEAMSEQHASMVYEQIDLHDQIARLRSEADSLRKDAGRWRYARTILAVEHIEAAYELCGHPSHVPNEEESARADQTIDAAMGARA